MGSDSSLASPPRTVEVTDDEWMTSDEMLGQIEAIRRRHAEVRARWVEEDAERELRRAAALQLMRRRRMRPLRRVVIRSSRRARTIARRAATKSSSSSGDDGPAPPPRHLDRVALAAAGAQCA